MKTEIEHCRHFDPVLFVRYDSCPIFKKEFEDYNTPTNVVDPVVSTVELPFCINYWSEKCPYYED